MYRIALICLLLFGLSLGLSVVQENNSTFDLTLKVESKEPEFNGQFEELDKKVDEIKEMMKNIYNSGLDKNMDEMSSMVKNIYNSEYDKKMDKMSDLMNNIYNSGLDEKVERMSEILENHSNTSEKTYTSCASLFKAGYEQSGVYTITPLGLASMKVYCDMNTAGGGWTIIQRRTSDEVDFYRTWAEYQGFFGDVQGNYWLGLEPIHRLTQYETFELYVKLRDFDRHWYYAKYSQFDVESEKFKYRLNVKGYTGTAGDSLGYHNGMAFSTPDRDNDGANCAVRFKGAWWYNNCYQSNLNGIYFNTKTVDSTSMNWWGIDPRYQSLKSSVMMIRPANF